MCSLLYVVSSLLPLLAHAHCKRYVPRTYHVRTTYERNTYASSTMSRHSGAGTKKNPHLLPTLLTTQQVKCVVSLCCWRTSHLLCVLSCHQSSHCRTVNRLLYLWVRSLASRHLLSTKSSIIQQPQTQSATC